MRLRRVKTRRDVLAWYARGRAAGRRARVVEVETHRDKILVQLRVVDRSPAGTPDVEGDRWQVLTGAGGRIVDIRGFETRDEAVTRLTPPAQ